MQSAIHTLVRFATEHIEERSYTEQVEIYEAVGKLLPSKADRIAAARLAFAIRETAKLQLEFTRLLNSSTNVSTSDHV